MNDLNELREMSRLGRIKIGLATIVTAIIGLMLAFVTTIVTLTGGVAIVFGSYKVIDLCDKIINKLLEISSNMFEAVMVKIIESEEEE